VDLPDGFLVDALTEFAGALEGALMSKALDEKVGGLTKLAKGSQGNTTCLN